MSYSSKQMLFAQFMLNKIGMSDFSDIEIYLEHLEKLYGKKVSYQNPNSYYGLSWFYSVSECIDMLKDEVELKKNKLGIKIIEQKKIITSTDLANYAYCPASYSIANTFLIENPSGVDFTRVGSMLHEELFVAKKNWYDDNDQFPTQMNNDLSKIKKSHIVFSGHNSDNKIFYNENWSGIPDYILQDSDNNYFVVEEKFHSIKTLSNLEDAANFHFNHIIQTASYIKNIKEYDIKYGYLLYWFYDYDDKGNLYIYKYETKKIYFDEPLENLYIRILQEIEKLRTEPIVNFEKRNLKMRKCAGCIVNKYCGHKTKKFDTLSFPYDKNYLNLYFALFPEELKRK